MGGAIPTPGPTDPRRTRPRLELGNTEGLTAVDIQAAIFDVLLEDQPAAVDRADAPGRQTMNEFLRNIDEVTQQSIISDFQAWAGAQSIAADFDDPDLFSQYQSDRGFGPPDAGGGGGGVGRTQFESERVLDEARAALAQEQAQTEAFVRENQRQRAGSEAFSRARDKFDLMQTAEQLADARRQAAVEALIAAAPFMVDPSQQFAPGFEPGGVGEVLGANLGVNVPNQLLPTAELPLNELANPPGVTPGADIAAALDPLLTAPGTPQIPF